MHRIRLCGCELHGRETAQPLKRIHRVAFGAPGAFPCIELSFVDVKCRVVSEPVDHGRLSRIGNLTADCGNLAQNSSSPQNPFPRPGVLQRKSLSFWRRRHCLKTGFRISAGHGFVDESLDSSGCGLTSFCARFLQSAVK